MIKQKTDHDCPPVSKINKEITELRIFPPRIGKVRVGPRILPLDQSIHRLVKTVALVDIG